MTLTKMKANVDDGKWAYRKVVKLFKKYLGRKLTSIEMMRLQRRIRV